MKHFGIWVVLAVAVLTWGCQVENDDSDDASSTSSSCGVSTSSVAQSSLNEKPLPNHRFLTMDEKLTMTISKSSSYQKAGKTFLRKGTDILRGVTPSCGGGIEKFSLKADVSAEDLVDQYRTDACTSVLEVDQRLRPAVLPRELQAAATFDDPQVSNQAHLTRINQSSAYDLFYNSTNGIQNDVVIAVIDSGVQGDHPDLTNKFWSNSGETSNGSDDDNNGYIDDLRGYNFASSTGDPEPQDWGDSADGEIHGTHVAGLAAAEANNSEGGIGVGGPRVKIMDLNIFGSSSSASIQPAIDAIQYAVDEGAHVINVSLAASGTSTLLENAISNAVSNGLVVVIAAGNEGQQITTSAPIMPAIYGSGLNGAITVGASYSDTGGPTTYTNYSTTYVEMMAPGSDASNTGLYSTRTNSTYTRLEGTSMATPLVSAAAAMVIGLADARSQSLTPANVESTLTSTVSSVSGLSSCAANGGVLDLEALYNAQ